MGLVDAASRMQDARATNTPAPGDAAASAVESPPPAAPPSVTTPPATATPPAGTPPAAAPPATAASPARTSESAPATAPDPWTAPAPGPQETPPPTGDDKRVQDAQAKMHEATTEAAKTRVDLEQALAENRELKDRLAVINVDPTLVPLAMPADLPTDGVFKAEIEAALTEYQTPKDGVDDAVAFRQYELAKVDILRRWDEVDRTRKAIARENANRELMARGTVKSAISLFVNSVEPDLPLDWFWAETRKPDVITAVPAEITDPVERLEYQAKVALQRCRNLLNGVRSKAATAGAQTERVQSAAGVVMPGGTSAAPPASATPLATNGQRRTLTDMVGALPAQGPAQPAVRR